MKQYNKWLSLLIITIISLVLISGCSRVNAYQKGIYGDFKKIVKQWDSYTYKKRVGSISNNEGNISFSKFSGMETLWNIRAGEESSITINYDFEIDKGDFKLVLINPKSGIEILKGSSNGEYEIELMEGKSRIKIVGREAKGKISIVLTSKGDVNIRKAGSD